LTKESRVCCSGLPAAVFIAVLLSSLLHGEDIVLKPLADSVLVDAATGLTKAMDAKDPDSLAAHFNENAVVCGPRLWRQIASSAPQDEKRVGKVVVCIHERDRCKAWGVDRDRRRTGG
jgi:hypothetical protein